MDEKIKTLEKILGKRILGIILEKSTASRIDVLTNLVYSLAGSYNSAGIRKWFLRSYTRLGDRSPLELLSGNWVPNGDYVKRIERLILETILL